MVANVPFFQAIEVKAGFNPQPTLRNINITFDRHSVTSIIGPSGCGKSTFIRCLNRLHEETPGAWVTGAIKLEGEDILRPKIDPVVVRRKIGMVFQKPNPFPAMSIFENVVVGLKLSGVRKKSHLQEVCERSLRQAALWDEVKDKLHAPGSSISGGQQQRLCIARSLAVEPAILLLDEPTSALDPISTAKVEELILELKKSVTIIIVTHNMQQARRISDRTAFFLLGDLVEVGSTDQVFSNPKELKTEQYISGKFG